MNVWSGFQFVWRRVLAPIARSWDTFWFQPSATTQLEIVRIGVGTALLFQYTMASPFLFFFWGDHGWVQRETALSLIPEPWMLSVFYYFDAPWQWIAFHTLFLCSLMAFTVGWRTSIFKWIVLIGHISYDHRDLAISYGAQSIATSLVLILCMAPTGRAISLDRVRAVRAAKRKDLNATLAPYTSRWANACTRLIQLQMVVLFFFSGVFKIRGDDWWGGDAIWFAFTINEFYNPVAVWLFAHQYWLVTVGTYSVILIEIAYAFLIWRRRTRPYMLTAAICLHLGFAFGLSLIYFAYIMICGHLSFLRDEWLARLGAWWKQKIGAMEMIYDGQCGFCVRSMAWLLAFDGLRQIDIRDFRTSPSPLVTDEQMEKALHLVRSDGRTLRGFDAYRYVVPRVPGLWWMVPLFYVPIVSYLVGRPVYNWVASHRGWISGFRWRIPRHTAAAAPAPIEERKAA